MIMKDPIPRVMSAIFQLHFSNRFRFNSKNILGGGDDLVICLSNGTNRMRRKTMVVCLECLLEKL